MPNKFTLNKKGYVEVNYNGPQTFDSIEEAGKTIQRLLHILHKEGKPRLVLFDATHVTTTTSDVRKSVVEKLHHLPYEKVAITGGGLFLRHLIHLIIIASGVGQKVRYFPSRRDAEAWLLE